MVAAVVAAVGALVFNGLQLRASHEQMRLTEQGQITDRFTKAIEQLGAPNPDTSLRLGGIYALERIMRDSPDADQSTVMEVLSAFIRDHTRPPAATPEAAVQGPPSIDVQAALTVLGRRDLDYDRGTRVDLNGAHLVGANLQGTHLSGANLEGSRMRDANLQFAKLEGANFEGADLRHTQFLFASLHGAYVQGANMRDAVFGNADLSGALLGRGDLQDAWMRDANLERANLDSAHLERANLEGANLTGASLEGAYMGGAKLKGAKLRGAKLTYADLTDADLTDADLTDASASRIRGTPAVVPPGRTLTNGDLVSSP